MCVAPKRSEEVGEEFFRVLLPHRCKFGVPASDKSLEGDWPDAFLEDRQWRRPRGGGGTDKRVLHRRICVCASRPRVPTRKQPVGNLEHLALDTRCRERLSASYPVLDCERGSVAPLEGREGKEDLNHGGHVAAVVGHDEFTRIQYESKRRDVPVAEVLKAR
jgi:hypothetical protein